MPAMHPPTQPSPESLARGVKNVPSGPRVLPRLQQLLADGNSSMQEIVDPIRRDQGIASRVLQMSNSSYYSKGARCSTVEESINRIGFKQVYSVVSNALCSDALVRPLVGYGLKAEEVWKISVAGGMAAERLATAAGEDRNISYTIGLLHGLGMVSIDSWLQLNRPGTKLTYRDFQHEFGRDEAGLVGFTQAEAGAALLELWGFPAAMVLPVRHQYSAQVPAEHARMVALLRLAKWLRNVVAGIYPAPPETADETQLRLLKLSQSQLDNMIAEIREEMQETRDMLAKT